MTRLFITRPRYDKGTEYLHAWSNKIIKSAEEHGWNVDKSEDYKVTKKEVHSRLIKKPANFVFFNGHGSDSKMCGHNHETILEESSSHLLKDSITFTRACNCVVGLGKSAVKNGCTSFIGYTGEFWIPRIHEYESTPLKDPAAKPVLEVSNIIPLSIIKKSTVSESINSSKLLAVKYISKLLVSDDPYDIAALKALSQNYDCLDYEGDGEAKVK